MYVSIPFYHPELTSGLFLYFFEKLKQVQLDKHTLKIQIPKNVNGIWILYF